jgi:hypothetical protein
MMNRAALLQQCRRPGLRARVGAAVAVLLLLAATFAVTHPLDSAAHANGQSCTVCLSAAALGAADVAAPPQLTFGVATPELVASVGAVLVSLAPLRRFARGPPTVSFAF